MAARTTNWVCTLAALALGCGSGGDGAGPSGEEPREPQNHAVTIDDGFFYPEEISIVDGDSVTWTWRFDNDDHSVTAGTSPDPSENPRLFDSGIRRSGNFGYRFTQSGSVSYFCREHWDMGMSGRVIVEP